MMLTSSFVASMMVLPSMALSGCVVEYDGDDVFRDSGMTTGAATENESSSLFTTDATGTITVQIDATNPAWVTGVRSYRLLPWAPAGEITSSPISTDAEALDANGAVLYTVALEMRIDLMASWANNAMTSQGSVGEPTAAELSSFFGDLNVTVETGSDGSADSQARAVAGLIVVSASLGTASSSAQSAASKVGQVQAGFDSPMQAFAAATQAANAPADYCVTEDEASSAIYGMWGAMALCAVEIGVAVAAPGVWAAVAIFAAESLSGGLGCTSIYGLLCDQLALVYRASCCFGDDLNYAGAQSYINFVCPFGDPIPDSEECSGCLICRDLTGADPHYPGWESCCDSHPDCAPGQSYWVAAGASSGSCYGGSCESHGVLCDACYPQTSDDCAPTDCGTYNDGCGGTYSCTYSAPICRSLTSGDPYYPSWVSCCDNADQTQSYWVSASGSEGWYSGSCASWGVSGPGC